ncbi:MAG: efflux RND transporter permease subunit, partial [Pseudomonadota bacterium]|nr:efflux RND transporter permease subunit [Pseudomonadota bacterium]
NVAGRIQEEMDSVAEQVRDFALSMMIIFALLAIPLRSYSQPFIIMSVIPFGVIGAMFGHMILGMTMSSLSVFGIIAVAGVVVNDSLVMVDFVNKARAEGVAIKEAVMQAGARRFRAILLTSITTFIGVLPIIMETSLQAKIVIPMAVSLAFGVLFATVITLILIPCQYVALEDFKRLIGKLRGKKAEPEAKLQTTSH